MYQCVNYYDKLSKLQYSKYNFVFKVLISFLKRDPVILYTSRLRQGDNVKTSKVENEAS